MKSRNEVETIISLVTYKAPEYVNKCLASLEWIAKDPSISLIIIDNSPDNSVEEVVSYSKIPHTYDKSGKNLGYGKGHNKAFNIACKMYNPKYLLIINADLTISKDSYLKLRSTLEDKPMNAIVGPQLLNSDGIIEDSILTDPSGLAYLWNFTKQLFNSGVDKKVGLRSSQKQESVKGVSGACLLLKCDAIKGEAIFDPDYQMYYEDLDLSHRLRLSGYKVIYEPEVKVEHVVGASSGMLENREEWQREMTYLSLSTYFKKNKGPVDQAILMLTLNSALKLRILLNRDKEWAEEMHQKINSTNK